MKIVVAICRRHYSASGGRLGQEDTISCESEAKVGKCKKKPEHLHCPFRIDPVWISKEFTGKGWQASENIPERHEHFYVVSPLAISYACKEMGGTRVK